MNIMPYTSSRGFSLTGALNLAGVLFGLYALACAAFAVSGFLG